MQIQSAELITTIPRKKPRCIAEKLLFPFIDWISLAFLPIIPNNHSQKVH